MEKDFSETYGSGSVKGTWGSDSLTISNLTVQDQAFALLTDASGLSTVYSEGGFDGLVGMGFQKLRYGLGRSWE